LGVTAAGGRVSRQVAAHPHRATTARLISTKNL